MCVCVYIYIIEIYIYIYIYLFIYTNIQQKTYMLVAQGFGGLDFCFRVEGGFVGGDGSR